MTHRSMVRYLVLSLALAAGSTAFAQVSFNIVVAPPEPMYEEVPMMQPGYVWAPGYWAWNNDHHVWVRGRSMVQRTGYRWQPDRWEQRDGAYSRQVGHWTRDMNAQPMKFKKMKQPKHNGNQGHKGMHGNGRMDERNDGR